MRAARDRGHLSVGEEHLLYAIAIGDELGFARKALAVCDVSASAIVREWSKLPSGYRATTERHDEASIPALGLDALRVLGRGEGLAIGLDDLPVRDHHVLLAIAWTRETSVALSLLTRLGCHASNIAESLALVGAKTPLGTPRGSRQWREHRQVAREEVGPVIRELRELGITYRMYTVGDTVVISVPVAGT